MERAEYSEDRCYLFVFGPGFGESIVLRFPQDHWMVVDGCVMDGASPAAELLKRAGAQWSCVALTHPHLDHASGLDVVLGMPGEGPVGCSDPRLPPTESWVESADPETQLRNGRLEQAMAAIHDKWTENEEYRWVLRRGDVRSVGPAKIKVLHPDKTAIEHGSANDSPNRLSAAMLIEWEEMRLLLGADVESPDWRSIGEWLNGLNAHACLKIPHHGADTGIGDCWLGGKNGRLWILTPFNRGRRLPIFEDDGGLSRLLENESPIHMTGLPVAADMQGRVPCHATRREILNGEKLAPLTAWLDGPLHAHRLPRIEGKMDCSVAVEFGRDGEVLDLAHGPGAVVVSA